MSHGLSQDGCASAPYDRRVRGPNQLKIHDSPLRSCYAEVAFVCGDDSRVGSLERHCVIEGIEQVLLELSGQ